MAVVLEPIRMSLTFLNAYEKKLIQGGINIVLDVGSKMFLHIYLMLLAGKMLFVWHYGLHKNEFDSRE